MSRIILAVTNDISNDRRLQRIAQSLQEEGHCVKIVGRRVSGSVPLSKQLWQERRMNLLFNKGFAFYAEYNIRLLCYLLFARYDVITANDLDTLPACFLASCIRRKRLVYDSHEYFTQVPELQHRPRTRAVWQALERHILPRLKTASTVCQSIANLYKAQYHVPFAVVRNLPNRQEVLPTPIEIPSLYKGQRILIYQGTLNQGRGLEQMIEAMQWVTNATLLVVGYGPLEDALKQQAKQQLPVHKYWFAGKVSPADLYRYTKIAHLGLSVELDFGLNYRYALPNKLFDYIQCHVPVLVSALPEMQSIVQHYHVGQILHSHQPHSIAKQINTLLVNEALLGNYSQRCAIAAKELCWEKERVLLLSLYV